MQKSVTFADQVKQRTGSTDIKKSTSQTQFCKLTSRANKIFAYGALGESDKKPTEISTANSAVKVAQGKENNGQSSNQDRKPVLERSRGRSKETGSKSRKPVSQVRSTSRKTQKGQKSIEQQAVNSRTNSNERKNISHNSRKSSDNSQQRPNLKAQNKHKQSQKSLKTAASLSNFKSMGVSPSMQTLNREASTQQLPPKPKMKKKTTLQHQQIAAEMYQSITSHPTVLKQNMGTTSGKKSVVSKQGQREAFSPIRRNQFVAQSQPNLRGISSGKKETQKSAQKQSQKQTMKTSLSQKQFSPASKSTITMGGNKIINIPSQGMPQQLEEDQISEGFNDRREEDHPDLETQRNAQNIAKQTSNTKGFKKIYDSLKNELQDQMKKSNERLEADQADKEARRRAKQERLQAIQANRQKQTQEMTNQLRELTMKNKKLDEKRNKDSEETERQKRKQNQQKLQQLKEKEGKRQYFTECQQTYKEQMKLVQKKAQKIKQKPLVGNKQPVLTKQADQVLVAVPSAPQFEQTSFNKENELSSISNDMASKNLQLSNTKKLRKADIKQGRGNPQIQELIKRQKRERSEKRKIEELQEREKSEKRRQNLINLQYQQEKKFKAFKKHNGLPTGRVVPSKKMIRDKSKSAIGVGQVSRARNKARDEDNSGKKKKSLQRNSSKEHVKVSQQQQIQIAQMLFSNEFGKRVNSESNLIKSIDVNKNDLSHQEFQAIARDALVKQSLNIESRDKIIRDDKKTDSAYKNEKSKNSSQDKLQSLSDKSSAKKMKKEFQGLRQSVKSHNDMVTIGTPGSTNAPSPSKGKKKTKKNAIPNKKMKQKTSSETPLSLPLQQQMQQYAEKFSQGISVSQQSKKEMSQENQVASTSKSTASIRFKQIEQRTQIEAAIAIQKALRGALGRQKAKHERQFQNIQNKFKRNKGSPVKTQPENDSPEIKEKHWESPKQTTDKKKDISVSKSEQNLKKILENESKKNKTSSIEFSKLGYKYQEASELIQEEEKALSKQSSKKPSGQKERPQNHSQDFDSMSSKNRKSQELDFLKERAKKAVEAESKTESFIMHMMNESKPKRQRLQGLVPLSDRSKSHHTLQNQLNEGDSWHFGGSRFQEEFPEEKSSRRVIPNQLSLAQRVKEEEERIEILGRKTQKKQEELEILRKKPALSPQSKRKMLALEKRVSKYQKEIEIGKQSQAQISNIIDQLASGKKFLDKNLFQNKRAHGSLDQSSELSQSNISIHSTPRVPIQALKQIPTASLVSVPPSAQAGKKKPFVYGAQEPEKPSSFISPEPADSSRKILESEKSPNTEEEERKQISEVLDFSKEPHKQVLVEGSPSLILSDIKMVRGYEDANEERKDVDALASAFETKEESPKAVDDSENQTHSSLSQMEQPDFAQNKKKPVEEEEKEKKDNLLILDADSSPLESKADRSPLVAEQSLRSPTVPEQPLQTQPTDEEEKKEEQLDLEDIFLNLREPESSGKLNQDQMSKLADELTQIYLKAFMADIEQSMFPPRVIIPGQKQQVSPISEQVSLEKKTDEEEEKHEIVDSLVLSPEENKENQEPEEEKKEEVKEEAKVAVAPPAAIQKIVKLRGIDTSKNAVDVYMTDIFEKIRETEEKFIEDLSTPLNKDPEEILMHLQNIMLDPEQEAAFSFQQSVLPVSLYLDIEKNKANVKKENLTEYKKQFFEITEPESESVQAEWENIHNKVLFDAVNEALDNYRPYGLRGPPLPWSQQTKTLTYRNGQQIDLVVKQVQQKVFEWSRTFAGALPCSELLLDYGIEGALDEERLNHLREERLALLLASEIEENEVLWTDYEYETTQTKLDLADMILETLAEEAILLLQGKDPAEALKPKKPQPLVAPSVPAAASAIVQVQDHGSSNAVGARSPESSVQLEQDLPGSDLLPAHPNVSQRSA